MSRRLTNDIRLEDAQRALAEGTGEGVRIAVIDTGIEVDHPDLEGLRLVDDIAIRNTGLSLSVVPGGGKDLYGHGTAIAQIIRAIAPRASIGSIRVLNEQLGGKTATVREGVRQALDRGYHILNCSFGCRGDAQFVMHYKEWIDEAYVKGVHVISACNNHDFNICEWPAYFPTVITVNMGRLAGLSFCYRPGHLVEFAAPGEGIEVAWQGGGHKKVTGSSYAAPHVAGLLARLLSVYPDLGPLEAKSLLHRLAEPYETAYASSNAIR